MLERGGRRCGLEGHYLVSFSPGQEALINDLPVFPVSVLQLVSHHATVDLVPGKLRAKERCVPKGNFLR